MQEQLEGKNVSPYKCIYTYIVHEVCTTRTMHAINS